MVDVQWSSGGISPRSFRVRSTRASSPEVFSSFSRLEVVSLGTSKNIVEVRFFPGSSFMPARPPPGGSMEVSCGWVFLV
jgi:hypothetical protein